MRRHKDILVVLLDGEHARFVRPDEEGNVLHTERRFGPDQLRRHSDEVQTDRPIDPHHDHPHERAKARFAAFIAAEINALGAEGFEGLVIAAPAHILNYVQEELRADIRAKLLGTVAKDLTKTPDDELWPHLKDYVPPPTPDRFIK
jgi:protein required for attachment to host cells